MTKLYEKVALKRQEATKLKTETKLEGLERRHRKRPSMVGIKKIRSLCYNIM